MERYLRGDSIYLGPTTPVNYRVMSTRINPYSGEMEITGMREEQGQFPVLPGLFLHWILMGLWNWLSGWLLSLFGISRDKNPLRLQFHYGYALKEDYPPGGYGRNGNNGYGRNEVKRRYNNGWENNLARELYTFD